jgi:hypothetical protein
MWCLRRVRDMPAYSAACFSYVFICIGALRLSTPILIPPRRAAASRPSPRTSCSMAAPWPFHWIVGPTGPNGPNWPHWAQPHTHTRTHARGKEVTAPKLDNNRAGPELLGLRCHRFVVDAAVAASAPVAVVTVAAAAAVVAARVVGPIWHMDPA